MAAAFDWLPDPGGRREGPKLATAAVARGQLDAGRRSDLAAMLDELKRSGTLAPRELARVEALEATIRAADARDPAFRPIRLHRPPGPL